MRIMELVLSFWASVFPSMLVNVRPGRLFWVGISGVVGWVTYTQMKDTTGWTLLSILLGALAVGIYSEVMARALKAPSTIFSVGGLFPLVPGIGAYSAIQNLVGNNLPEAARNGIQTVSSAGAIALGIMTASLLFRFYKRLKLSIKN